MEVLAILIVAVGANIISHYVCKWFDSKMR